MGAWWFLLVRTETLTRSRQSVPTSEALCTLCDDVDMSENLQLTLAKFVCTAYRPKGIPELCWHLFCKYMAESEKLPPTFGALKQHILKAHVQARVWGQAAVPQQLPQGQRWRTTPANHHWCPTSTGGHRGDGQVSVQGKLLIESLFMQVQELAMHGLCLCNTQCENDVDTHYNKRESDDDSDG